MIAALLAVTPVDATACIWDRDTLAMERRRFPGALHLITGHFVHHGPDFYAWRIADRSSRLEERPDDLRLLDDLAAAYDKTGDHAAAISTMERALLLAPERYETHANLGTFHAHSGHLDQALVHIDRALEINPQAHFGRERYQALLLRYLQKRGMASLSQSSAEDFASYVFAHGPPGGAGEQQAKAIEGVLGMMHFGKHDSPVLLAALASLLAAGYVQVDAAQLAARAYLRASQRVEDPKMRKAYRAKAKAVLHASEGIKFRHLEASLEQELAAARAFVARMRADEADFLDTDDPEAAFDAKYFSGMDMSPPNPIDAIGRGPQGLGVAAGGTAGLILLLWGVGAIRRRRRGF